MHDIKSIRDNPQVFDAALKRRGLKPLSASLLAIDEKRRAAILASEQAQARRNAASKEIGDAKKSKDEARAANLMAEVAELKTTMPQLETAAKAADEELARELAAIPNLPTPPTGFAVAAYPTYASAQAAVEHLMKNNFSIQDVTIVGSDLQMVERVTGRLTAGKLAAAGAASGAWMGLFFGLLLFFFSPVQGAEHRLI